MSNIIKIKRGAGAPSTSNTTAYELGFDTTNKILYINDNGTTITPLGNSFLGGVTTAASARSTIGAAPTSHTHTYSQITGIPIDTEPTEGSTNFVTSGGVYKAIPRAVDGQVGWTIVNGPDGKPEWTVSSDDILEMIFPIGAVYISVVDASPAQFFSYETTWDKITDKFLVGAGSTYTLGQTGGAAEVALTVDQMPSHAHSYSAFPQYDSGGFKIGSYNIWTYWTNFSKTSGYTGGGAAHNNLPPYLAVYIYKRVQNPETEE